MNQERGYHHRDYSRPHGPPRDDDCKYAKEARKHDGMTSKVVNAVSHSIAHRGTQATLENPKHGMQRLLLMNEPGWKALTEMHTVGYCAWDHPYTKPENIRVSEFGWKLKGTTGDGLQMQQ